ncbi:hypothetical protein L0U85_10680 [Glycomyces sp. L485]|uniref:hypothetical protein n=1 Tax=Glycomyces sp. L485 TaxID=2909235 RepID=UPI001F4AD3BA|nr:hypothetical protein [Glycomyces sp. L485]MCH7231310.1 hypothetical protein [Glycomyces sp. L485]
MSIRQQNDAIDRLAMTYLPERLGEPSDFEFEWGKVEFVQRVWESQIEDAWRVDLQVHAMRGARLTDAEGLREFLIDYHEKDADWATEPLGDNGFAGEREAVVLLEPGLAAEVRDPFGRQGIEEVKHIAAGIRLLEL